MALQDLATNLSAALSQLYAPKAIRAFNRRSILAAELPKVDGKGKNCAWELFFSGASAASYTDGADVSTYDVDVPVAATLSWSLYRSSFSISGLAQAAAQSSGGSAEELLSLIETSADNSLMKLTSTINAGLFAGTGSGTTLTGLATALAASGTYAGVSRSTYTEWAANVSSNGAVTRSLTKGLLDSLEGTIYDACGESPNLIIMPTAMATKYESLFDSQTKVILTPGNDLSPMQGGGAHGNNVPMSGFTGFTYKGIPVYRDRDCTASTVYMLNTNYMAIESLPFPKLTAGNAMTNVQGKGAMDQPVGINVCLEPMAKTGDADKWTMKVYLALKITKCSAHGVLSDVS